LKRVEYSEELLRKPDAHLGLDLCRDPAVEGAGDSAGDAGERIAVSA
jgi:hypothetical protein